MNSSGRIYLQAGVVVCIVAIVLSLGLGPITKAQIKKKSGDDTSVGDQKGLKMLGRKDTAETEMIQLEKLDINSDGGIPAQGPAIPATGIDLGEESEPNGTTGTANLLTGSEGRIEGLIAPNGDVDFYQFTAATGNKLHVALMTSGDFASAGQNSILDVFASDGTTILETDLDDGTFASTSSTIAGLNIPSNGTYYLRVRHNSTTSQIRSYFLYFAIRSGAATAEAESNNTPGTATPLAGSGHMSGNVSPAADVDFYSLSLNAGDTVFLSLNSDPERDNVQFNARLGFGLFGSGTPNQILLANDASVGSATNPLSEAFFFTVKDAGTYFIYVDEALAGGAATFTYTLSATVFPGNNDSNCTTYASTDVPKAIPADPALTSSTITIPAGTGRINSAQVYLDVTHTFMQDLDFHLVSPRANDNGLITDIGGATVGGAQTGMNLWLDDDAAIPPVGFALSEDFRLRPETAYQLEFFNGEYPAGIWRLDVRDDAVGDAGTINNWSLRICTETTPGAQILHSQDFESGAGGFTHSGTADEWELGLPATIATATADPLASFQGCYSGVSCWKTDLDGSYNLSSSQNLESPAIPIPAGSSDVELSWAMRYQIENASFDHAWIEVFESGNPAHIQRVGEWTGATMVDSVGNPAVNIGQSGGWGVFEGEISPSFAGTSVVVRFHLDSDDTVVLGGLAIDDVKITRGITRAVRADYDGDGKTDLSIWRPVTGTFWVNRSTDGPAAIQWGANGDYAMGGDTNNDRETDLIINRPTVPADPADFWVLQTPALSYIGYAWGIPGDKPMIRDFNGDGSDDYAVWRESDTKYYILVPGDPVPVRIFQFGLAGDKPFVGDFFGDNKAEIAVFRPTTGIWYIAAASGNPATEFISSPFGIAGDLPVPADYDGDGKDDVAVFRPSTGFWYIRNSGSSTISIVQFGTAGDVPVPGDYDGDGKYDVAIYRNGQWWRINSSNSSVVVQNWGVAGDQAIPASYLPQ